MVYSSSRRDVSATVRGEMVEKRFKEHSSFEGNAGPLIPFPSRLGSELVDGESSGFK